MVKAGAGVHQYRVFAVLAGLDQGRFQLPGFFFGRVHIPFAGKGHAAAEPFHSIGVNDIVPPFFKEVQCHIGKGISGLVIFGRAKGSADARREINHFKGGPRVAAGSSDFSGRSGNGRVPEGKPVAGQGSQARGGLGQEGFSHKPVGEIRCGQPQAYGGGGVLELICNDLCTLFLPGLCPFCPEFFDKGTGVDLHRAPGSAQAVGGTGSHGVIDIALQVLVQFAATGFFLFQTFCLPPAHDSLSGRKGDVPGGADGFAEPAFNTGVDDFVGFGHGFQVFDMGLGIVVEYHPRIENPRGGQRCF